MQVKGGDVDRTVRAGKKVNLTGIVSDPDGDELTTTWWQYRETGTYKKAVNITNASTPKASFKVPAGAKSGQTTHLILEVQDRTDKPMTRYARVVVTVR